MLLKSIVDDLLFYKQKTKCSICKANSLSI